jgi:MerR family transcriptional regulator/heat shock protein HspR
MANEDSGRIWSLNKLAENKLEKIDKACEILCTLLKPRQSSASSSEPRYVISVASRIVGIEAHTLRYYERLGLIQPGRSGGNTRLYSQDDIDQLCCLKSLMGDLRVNLAGVEVALHLVRKMEEIHQRVREMEEELKRLVEGDVEPD